MIIKKLEIQGFKSFSDRTRMVFHPGITAVVGPNGTGKSNIVDALLWVLRGRRQKSLRGDRSGDVIFNGNQKIPPLSMADVSLFLTDDKDQNQEDIVINHRVFRSGENEYRLNGKLVRLKDIHATLWKHAIGEADYFVIEQGSIGVFLSSKPLEKRLLLEEAAGTAFYKDKKRQAENKLENSEQNLIRLEDIIIEVEKAKNSLNRQAHAAIRYRKLRETIRSLTLSLYRQKYAHLEKDQAEISRTYLKCLDTENSIIASIKAEEKNLSLKRKNVWDFEKLIKEEQNRLYSHKSQLARVETEKDKEEKRIDYFEEKHTQAQKNKKEFQQELEILEKDRSTAAENIESLQQSLAQKQKEMEKAQQAGKASSQDLESRQQRIQNMRDEYLQKISAQTDIKNEAAKIEKEIELYLRQEEKLRSELDADKSLFQEKKDLWEENKKELSQALRSLKLTEGKTNENQKTLDAVLTEITQLEDQISHWQRKKDENLHHLSALEKLKESKQNKFEAPEFAETLGLFADLIESSVEHTPLIDIFYKDEAGAALIHTQQFMTLLEKQQIKGRFLLLHPSTNQGKIQPPDAYQDKRVLGLLKSQMQADPKIKHHLGPLADAAIVQDIKSAVELWLVYPSLNFITPKGELLLSSGMLHMGETQEGLFTLNREIKSAQNRLAEIEKKIIPLAEAMKQKSGEQQKLEAQNQSLAAEINRLERHSEARGKEIEFIHTEKERIQARIELLGKEMSNLVTEKRKMSEKQKRLILQIEQLRDEENSVKQATKREEDEHTAMRQQIEQNRKQFFELRTGVDLLREKISSTERRIQEIQQRQDGIQSKLELLTTEIQKAEEEKTKLRQRVRELSSQVAKIDKDNKAKEAKLIQDETQLTKIQSEQQSLEENLAKLREDYEEQKEERVKWEVRKAEKDRDLVNLEESCWQELNKSLKEVKDEKNLDEVDTSNVEESLTAAKEKLERFKNVNLMAEEEYQVQKKRYDFLIKQKEDLRESIDSTKEAIKKIDQESKAQFLKALIAVNKNFQNVFSTLFQGGTATIKLSDENDPLESGIEIIAQPPGKKLQSLTLLSGGEKSLTSLAFFFALFRYKPAPFCILDEVDAALDEVNLTRFLNLMMKIKDQTQFIIITHNFKTMEVADYIYGTTMAEPNVTSIYSVRIEGEKAHALLEKEIKQK